MTFSILEKYETNCNGDFKVGVRLSHDKAATVPVRALHRAGFDTNVQNIQLAPTRATIQQGQTEIFVVSGQLIDRCKNGELAFEWVETIQGQDLDHTRDQQLLIPKPCPLKADDSPDPVTAERSGKFEYDIDISCCEDTLAGPKEVDFNTFAAANIAHMKFSEASPFTTTCPLGDIITVTGILSDPAQGAIARVNIVSGGKCSVITTINPHRVPDHEAHRRALELW